MSAANAVEWGRIELEETKIGRLDHKIEKLQILKNVPGVEWLRPYGLSGYHGITLEENTPFGVIGAGTPSTHSIPTLSGNIINMVAAGNAVVFNTHPSATRCAVLAVRAYNQAIARETGIENLCCIIEQPTMASFQALCAHEQVRLLCVTGGPGVGQAALKAGKRAICAGPGNPPVLVDDTASMYLPNASGRTEVERSVLTRAAGSEQNAEVHLKEMEVAAGDLLLLCSDGLYGSVPQEQIAAIVGASGPTAAQTGALIAAARSGGAPDNVSAVLLRFQ